VGVGTPGREKSRSRGQRKRDLQTGFVREGGLRRQEVVGGRKRWGQLRGISRGGRRMFFKKIDREMRQIRS